MYPTFIATLKAAPSVTGLFGSNPLRVVPAGAEQKPVLPYVSHQLVAGSTANYLGSRSDSDSYRVQFNVYAATAEAAMEGARVIREALESGCYVVSLNPSGRDPETKNFFYSMDLEFMQSR